MSIKYFSDLKKHFSYVLEIRSISLGNIRGKKIQARVLCDAYYSSTTSCWYAGEMIHSHGVLCEKIVFYHFA